MSKLAFPLSLAALAVLGACATYEPAAPAPVIVTQPAPVVTTPGVVTSPGGTVVAPQVATAPQRMALVAGNGRIESISAVPSMSASVGGSAPASKRLAVRMDNGSIQYVDTDARDVSVGDQIELTHDGYIRRR